MTLQRDHLSQEERNQLLDVVDRATAEDGISPVNESALLIIGHERPGTFFLSHADDEVVGFAVADEREHTIVVAVDPAHRRQRRGRALLTAALAQFPRFRPWAFGTLEAARALAAATGLEPRRELLKLGRELGEEPVPEPPADYTIRSYQPGDAEHVVAVNRLAFAHHPEQGKLTLDEFLTLTQQPWFSAEGLLVATRGNEIAGFHWTKRHDEDNGEVYVLAVHPDHGGRGLGRSLLEAGLAHLADIGCSCVLLFVEASEVRVVGLYESARFGRISVDTSYQKTNDEDVTPDDHRAAS